jgi:hypothetical protein
MQDSGEWPEAVDGHTGRRDGTAVAGDALHVVAPVE